jgi:alpha-N-acetylglucosamine transferase
MTRDLLRKAGFEVQVKPSLDCMSAHGSGASEIALYPGEYMRLYGWNMTQYDKIVYVDCDIMLLDNIDELFETPIQVFIQELLLIIILLVFICLFYRLFILLKKY